MIYAKYTTILSWRDNTSANFGSIWQNYYAVIGLILSSLLVMGPLSEARPFESDAEDAVMLNDEEFDGLDSLPAEVMIPLLRRLVKSRYEKRAPFFARLGKRTRAFQARLGKRSAMFPVR